MSGKHVKAGPSRPVDFSALARRLQTVAGVLGVLALGGAILEGLLSGLTFAVLITWAVGYVAAVLLVAGVLVALHAYRGADAAQRHGRRLSGPDVGLLPRRRPPGPPPRQRST